MHRYSALFTRCARRKRHTLKHLRNKPINFGRMTKTDISKLIPYCGKYMINFQLWGPGNYNIYIEKDGIDLWSWGGGDTAQEAIDKAVEYLNRINKVKP